MKNKRVLEKYFSELDKDELGRVFSGKLKKGKAGTMFWNNRRPIARFRVGFVRNLIKNLSECDVVGIYLGRDGKDGKKGSSSIMHSHRFVIAGYSTEKECDCEEGLL